MCIRDRIRTVSWFGLTGVVCSPRTVDVWNAKTIQSSMGSVFNTPLIVTDLKEFLKSNEISCIVLDAGGENLHSSDYLPGAIVVGSESHGVSENLREMANEVWSIPGSGNAESLNASIAGSIACSVLAQKRSSLSS